MLPTIGSFCLHASFVAAAATLVAGVLAGRTGKKRYNSAAVYGGYIVFGLIAMAASLYVHAILTHDFTLTNVVKYSDTRMPWYYLVTAFWGGQAGSLLFWTSTLVMYFAIALTVHRKKDAALIPWFISVVMALVMFLTFILLFASNPFETWHIVDAPKEGQGLNPLLQTPLMLIHPPSLLQGYSSMAIPFAFGMAAMLAGRTGNEWLKPTRYWLLVSWLWLTMGNMLGGMWAYEELGWGGYWAWDPVENAAFMPWLAATAFLHSIMVQERRGMLKRWNVALLTISFLLTLFGTFITRSGLIDSVHTFAQSDIGNYFFALVVTFTTLSVVMLAVRWKDLRSEGNMDSALSREAAFLANNWVLMGMVFVVFWGTMFPKIKEMITGDKVSVGPPWFNKYMVPLGLILVVLMAIGTLITWKKSSWKNFQRNFLVPVIGTVVLTPLLCVLYWFTRYQSLQVAPDMLDIGYATTGLAASVFVIMSVVFEFYRGAEARMRSKKEGLLEAVVNLFDRQRRRYGGYIVHLGFVLVIIAFCGNAFKVEQDVTMRQGETVPLGDYEVTYSGLSEVEDSNRALIVANLVVSRNGRQVAIIEPGRAIYHSSPDNPTSEIAINSGPIEDLYFALASFSEGGQVAGFKMIVSPLTWWFWFGVGIMVFGTAICLWPEEVRMPATVYRRAARQAAGLAVLAAFSAAPLVFWTSVGRAQSVPAQEVEAAHDDHEHAGGGGEPFIRVHDARMKRLMAIIRVDCPNSGRPTMANSAPTCTDFQQDLRLLEKLMRDGKSDDEILDHFVEMRGEWVLAQPRNKGFNWLSWALPVGVIVVAVPLLGMKVRQWTQQGGAPAPAEVSLKGERGAAKEEDDYYKSLLQQELEEA